MNLTKLVIILVIALIVISFIFALSLVSMHNKYAEIINKKDKDIEELKTALNNSIEEKVRIEQSYKKKQEVSNETNQKLADIATSSTQSSTDRLQKPRSRKSKTTSNS